MLNELKDFQNLGTPNYFLELFSVLLKSNRLWTIDNINSHFYNRIVDKCSIFDGCLPLALAVGALTQNDGYVYLDPSLINSLINVKYLSSNLLKMILNTAKNDEIFFSIFCPENISYDVIYKLIQIDNSAFRFRFANFRRLLISFGLLYPHPDKNIKKLIVNSKYKKMFDTVVIPEVRKRQIGISQLNQLLSQQQIFGKEAEEFVLQFEKKRLESHPTVDSVQIISEYDVGAGYDLVSYDDVCSTEFNRFIEVKSYTGTPSFHWSRNEVDVARIKKSQYYLYLVNRDLVIEEGYKPIIIKNPHENVFENKSNWDVLIDGYFVVQRL